MLASTVVFTFAVLVSQASAALFMTSPTATTPGVGGQLLNVNWEDKDGAPSLSDIGPCEVGLYAGSVKQQTEVQQISPSLDVGKQTNLSFTVNPGVGENSDSYFVRFTSLALKDTNNTNEPYQSFSAKFSLSGMSGQFNQTIKDQIAGVAASSSTAAPQTTAVLAAPSTSGLVSTRSVSSSGSKTASSSTTSHTSSPSNAASPNSRGAGAAVLFAAGALAVAAL